MLFLASREGFWEFMFKFRPCTKITQNCLNIFLEILKKCLNIPNVFLKISTNALNISRYLVYCFKNKPFLNSLSQNFLLRELKSMSEIVYTNSITIKQLSKQHGCKLSFLTNVLSSWYVSPVYLYRTEYSVKKMARKS